MKQSSYLVRSMVHSLIVASGAAAMASVAHAEDAATGGMEEIVVSGFRQSLIKSETIKKESSTIVEALTAEDIGKLPDTSIAESLARLPGLAGERSGGRVSGIAVRGFKEDFTGTSLNGREIIGIGDNRGVEYDLYPSEIMSGAVIYKAADASLLTQGIGGTVDMRTVRPLDARESLTVNATFENGSRKSDNPEFGNTGYRGALSWTKHFADDRVGIAIALADTLSPTNQRNYGVWGYGANANGQYLPFGLDTQSISKELSRKTASGVLQWKISDGAELNLDALHIDYSDKGVIRGFIEPFSADPASLQGTGANVTGTQIGANPVIRTDPENIVGKLQSFGGNLKLQFSDNWSGLADVSHSKSSKLYERAESYAGLGRNGSLTPSQFGSRTFKMSPNGITFTGRTGLPLDSFDAVKLTGPQQWGGGMASVADHFASSVLRVDGQPYSFLEAQDGFWNHADFAEELNTGKLELQGEFSGNWVNKVTFGVQYSDRDKSKVNHGDFATAKTFPYGAGAGSVVDGTIPTSYRYGVADLTWAGLGKVVAYDGFAPYRDGYYALTPADYLEPDRLGDTFSVKEKVSTFYAKADFKNQLAGKDFFGNVGFQYVHTNQHSDGYLGIVNSNLNTCLVAGSTPWAPKLDASCQISGGASYSNFLPSLNLNLAIDETKFLRFAASKTISRARMDQLKASGFVKFDQNIDKIESYMVNGISVGTPWSKSQGNPTLRPLESENFDLSYEWYFAKDGYVSATVFRKNLVNWTDEGQKLIDFSHDATNGGANYYIPGFHDRTVLVNGTVINGTTYNAGAHIIPFHNGTAEGYFSSYVDGLKGHLNGAELTASIPLRLVSDVLDGIGIAGSAAYNDGKLDNGKPIIGQSKHVYSLTAYFERGGFEARVAANKRSDYATYERGGSNKIADATRAGTTVVDAQIGYDFSKNGPAMLNGVKVSLQGTNLTNEGDINLDGNGLVTRNRQFGAVYLLNVTYTLR
ncbi:MAG: hypothetical protein RLZZ200_2000 [Pseudomonadota bacterium]